MNQINDESSNTGQGTQPAQMPRRKRRWGLRFSLGFAIAAILLAVGCYFLWQANRNNQKQINQMTARLQMMEVKLQHNNHVVQTMTSVIDAPDTVQVTLAHQTGTPPGEGHVLFNARMGVVVYSGEISPAPPDKVYQLWLMPSSGAPVNAGVVEANQQSKAAVAHVPQNLSAKAFAVTLEPKGGKPQPTGPKVLVGAVASS